MRQRSQVRIRFCHIHAFKTASFFRGDLHGARAFDEDFSGLALCPFESQEWRVGLGIMDRSLHRDEKLVLRWLGAFTLSVNTPDSVSAESRVAPVAPVTSYPAGSST